MDIQLVATDEIHGIARDRSNNPLPNAIVYLERDSIADDRVFCTTDDCGRFGFSGVNSKSNALLLCLAEGSEIPLVVARGIVPSPDLILLSVSSNHGTLSGRLALKGEGPALAPRMLLRGASLMKEVSFSVDPETGAWASPQVPDGEYTLALSLQGKGTWQVGSAHVVPGADTDMGTSAIPEPHDIVVHTTLSRSVINDLALRSVRSKHSLLPQVLVTAIFDKLGQPLSMTPDGFIIHGVPAGDYVLTLNSPGGTTVQFVSVTEGRPTEIHVGSNPEQEVLVELVFNEPMEGQDSVTVMLRDKFGERRVLHSPMVSLNSNQVWIPMPTEGCMLWAKTSSGLKGYLKLSPEGMSGNSIQRLVLSKRP